MKGIEFSLVHSVVPTLFLIRRQERISPAVALPISSFYIVDGTIYQSPDLYSVLANRLVFFVCVSLPYSLEYSCSLSQ